ncbi:RNA polymerase sigma factor [Tamlana fucoidanivorans]|uniref:RNA polymerase sigma factor n=1 Tax=Allotamlana fucoidanivorans TaxID=2583814 RepID=A0A5C4SNX0_9FLAO|nr:RNA polymerase sigma factor [Tamlana fucoidanivorans]TNJ45717.1 RNA polymerase sigma factor [Tamlana fucoidanivorans]
MKPDNNKKLKDFFNQEYQALKGYVSSRIKTNINRDPEDILQDVALKLFTSADRYSPINNVAGFVYRAVKNSIIDVLRSNKNYTVAYENKQELKLIALAESFRDEGSGETFSETLKLALRKAITELKPKYREIIIAIDFEGYSYKEIAKITKTPIGTLMSRRHRAMSLLNKKLKTIS